MLSGRRLDLLNPSPLDVEISDIAHGLARVARWNGQTIGDYPFSVAQHSILVLEIVNASFGDVSPKEQLFALLHDAAEYVMGDIISPFKAAMGGNYKEIEDTVLSAIHLRFSLPAIRPPLMSRHIKKSDREAAYYEAVNLAGFVSDEARRLFGAPSVAGFELDDFELLIRPLPTGEAQARFIERFEQIAAKI
ncbi:COG1896: Predicted hydrolases of HD superfamily [hydrothermal vent metagenome]|uniref:COG1896: Predicted hydrolases of HD superfamily n=1 Tax=hydrothermal vent metagenome TaxID=652676 RepID=A0A3B0UCU3_9ZZZZ